MSSEGSPRRNWTPSLIFPARLEVASRTACIKKKLSKKNKVANFQNLNHYRDFLSTKDICKAIFFLWKKRFCGIINIGSGKKIYLKNIVRLLAKKKKVRLHFFDNVESSYLVANISKIKRLGWKPRDNNIFSTNNK